MSQFIVDFQGFKDNRNRFIVKEIAILSIKGGLVQHYFVKSPYYIDKLSPFYRDQALFNSKHYHGIPWYKGNVYFNKIKTYLGKLFCERSTVYVKGFEKAIFIQETFPDTHVVDLELFPSLKRMTPNYNKYCFFHRNTKYMCAYNNVYKILYHMRKIKFMT